MTAPTSSPLTRPSSPYRVSRVALACAIIAVSGLPFATLAQPTDPAAPAPKSDAPKPAQPPANPKPDSAPAKPTPPATGAPAPTGAGNVDQVIKNLENAAPKREVIQPSGVAPVESVLPNGKGSADTSAKPGTRLLREGTFLASRRGRMVRSAAGEWVYHFDSDSAGLADPPMILLPCLNLMAMEKLAEKTGESLTFNVSGQVFVYRGKNYLLPTMYVLNRRGETNR